MTQSTKKLPDIKLVHLGIIFSLCLLGMIFAWFGTHRLDAKTAETVSLAIELDRSKLPSVNDDSISLLISIGEATGVTVKDGGNKTVTYTRLPGSQQIMVTTTATKLTLTLEGLSDFTEVGQIQKARLKDNKRWAWSHSFDDNHYLDGPIGVMQTHQLPATMYIVGSWIDNGNSWEGDLPETEIIDLLENGWSLGNHTLDHDNNCGEQPPQDVRRDGILQTAELLDRLIARSNRPDYKVISFAVPCGGQDRFEAYHELILEMREAQSTDILFSEGGYDEPLVITVSDTFDFDAQIKRDLAIDGVQENSAELKAIFDSMSQSSTESSDQIYWYNSFSHGFQTFGDNTTKLNEVASYFVDTYGVNGTNEAWMAPADEIYSYLLVRGLTQISTTLNLPELPTPTVIATLGPPSPTPSLFPSPIATPTPIIIPTKTPTPHPPTPNGPSSNPIIPLVYLPFVR